MGIPVKHVFSSNVIKRFTLSVQMRISNGKYPPVWDHCPLILWSVYIFPTEIWWKYTLLIPSCLYQGSTFSKSKWVPHHITPPNIFFHPSPFNGRSRICRIFLGPSLQQQHWRVGGTQEFRWTLMLCPCLLALRLFQHSVSMSALIWVLPLCLRNHSQNHIHWFILSQGPCSFTVLLRTQSLSQSLRKWDHCYKGDQESSWKGAGAIKSNTEECSDL